jgi:acetylornithine deacetylase/succinyl-diaminopimelate desuccinylase-like protein
VKRRLVLALALAGATGAAAEPAPEPDWPAAGQEAARLLSELIRIDTSNPPGRETPAAEHLRRFFAAEGIEAEVFEARPGRGNVVARVRAAGPQPAEDAVLLLAHLDVVPADPDAWAVPPFSGAIVDGVVHGRGAIDDKGQAVVHALALALLERTGVALRRDIVFCGSAGEETEGEHVGVDWMIDERWEALGPPAVVWNEGGFATQSSLAPGRVLAAVATSEKRALWITLVAEGRGGHGSQPHGEGAVDVLLPALERVRDWKRPLRVTDAVAESFSRLADANPLPRSLLFRYARNRLLLAIAQPFLPDDGLVVPMLQDTLSLTGLSGGTKHNVIPRRATATLDVRLLPDSDAQAFLRELGQVIDDPRVRIEVQQDPLPAPEPTSPADHELLRAIEAEMERELPGSLTLPFQTVGGTDSKWFREKGIPAYGLVPVLASRELVATMHGLDERVPIEELERGVRITYRALRRVAEAR